MKWITARRRHPLAGYVVVILALVVFGVGYTFLAPTADRAQAQQAPSAGESGAGDGDINMARGKQIFVQSCASCHGENAEGLTVGDTEVPSLIGVGAAAVDFQVSTGRMPSANVDMQMPRRNPVFTQDEIDDLVAYYKSEFGGEGPDVPEGVPAGAPERDRFEAGHKGDEAYEKAKREYEEAYQSYVSGADTEAGMKLYLTNCAHCHSWSGAGGALTDGRWAPELTESSPRQIYEAMLTGPAAMPVFNDEVLTPENKKDIIAYVNELQSEPDAGGYFALGRIGQVAEGFIGWTVGLGLIVACAIWITAKQRAHD